MNSKSFFERMAATLGGDFVRLASEKVNTCNGWGFGGWYGHRHLFTWNGKQYELRDGKAPTRFGEVFRVFLVVARDNCYAKWQAKNFLESVAEGLTPGAE